ncbi:GNAT family N-acetyltransferase [Thalassotalea sp. G2M2-11]|uniref:GNAT family N-acetyltransferase n=1 Tax=Thalassotalea sp. G2M2-11 TaxID=2787627 RepID=UPI0019D03B08|nr:GNAT family N-acetyltransferase [Thalassotalea sp. G2M2-11]
MDINDSTRLSFRLMNSSDIDALWQLDQDPEVMKYITGGIISTRDRIINTFIPRMQAYRNEDKGWGLWQVNLKQTDEYLGWILVRPMNFFSDHPEADNLELGWRFFRSSWGKGYASEAAQHIKNILAQNKAYRAFSAIAATDNLGSINIMQKIGMSYVKTYHHVDPLFECDIAYYQIKNR